VSRYVADYLEQAEPQRRDVQGTKVFFGKGISLTILADSYEAAMELAFINAPEGYKFHSLRATVEAAKEGHETRMRLCTCQLHEIQSPNLR
jgi:hypothetical protein